MRKCTVCQSEFQDWVSSCLVCGGLLTPRPDWKPGNQVFAVPGAANGNLVEKKASIS